MGAIWGGAQWQLCDTNGQPIGRQLGDFYTDGRVAAGDHRVAWDGRDDGAAEVASGVYVVRLEAAGQVESRRVLVLK